ncbi:uncharacterized protein LDX57_004883 [Aspergillus melleus]|uniref:uncharacterized protein n=1 Tax=Aspergillus melleus TaxID=138277 RepID=UPI001E8CEDFF|nr:uncharacterized protein LDX57_004883 [Aspergillus melleus]KAH8427168.1 hypothetical protein LDX57_004883 [Aspergillus melleus]
MSSAKQTLVHTGPAIPERPAAPRKLCFSVPNVAPEKSHTVLLSAVVLEHLQFNIISRKALAKLPDEATYHVSNGKTERIRETFYVESDDSEEWDSSIDVLLSPESELFKGYLRGGLKFAIIEFDPRKPKVPGSAHRDYLFGVLLFTLDNHYHIYRQLGVDFEGNVNIMSSSIQKRLNIRMDPYTGPRIQLQDRSKDVQPIGSIEAPWKFVRKDKVYWTRFLVIDSSEPDLLLGRPSIKECGFMCMHPEVSQHMAIPYA